MANIERTSLAEADLTDIFVYIAEDNLPAAERVLRSIGKKCDLLAGTPGMGRERPELGHGTYSRFFEALNSALGTSWGRVT
jgi:toxin ParE1/3/4